MSPSFDADLAAARAKYMRRNREALEQASLLLPDALDACPKDFSLEYPTRELIRSASGWTLPWVDFYDPHWVSDTKRFGCVIHHESNVCGIALGRLMAGSVYIEMIEGNPDVRHPFKGYVLDTVELVALIYAQLNAVSELRLIDPVQGAMTHYLNRGYQMASGSPRYCWKKVW
ncbi:hypothetical protein [Rhizobium leguminosarum]|uniref:hypothetical protein n=1 Tax=Rhizobium leguminosarum TaxID=384 RepID=UPI001032353D|nr:hypothetical protein [Rhizobium leguminosarum]TAY98599.1 hypothetical protein ELH79_09000 [Rhizobium leguminosarum]TAZ09364.1 hypothetical protein ELH78_09000 [Rhizobium leguminosarum]